MIANEFEEHPARYTVKRVTKGGLEKVRRRHHPAFLIRYADDWVIVTDTVEHAERLYKLANKYLKQVLYLELSQEKTLITDMREKPIKFLGFMVSARKARLHDRIVGKPVPDAERIRGKFREVLNDIRTKVHACWNKPLELGAEIEIINAKIVGISNYYKVGICKRMYKRLDTILNYRLLKTFQFVFGGGTNPKIWRRYKVRLCDLSNRRTRHLGYKSKTFGIQVDGIWIGFTMFSLTPSVLALNFNQKLTPYTDEGRKLYEELSQRRLKRERETLYDPEMLRWIPVHRAKKLSVGRRKYRSFEYVMNREYAYLIDKGLCRICRSPVNAGQYWCHHIRPWLPPNLINKVSNLATMHIQCQNWIHATS